MDSSIAMKMLKKRKETDYVVFDKLVITGALLSPRFCDFVICHLQNDYDFPTTLSSEGGKRFE